MFCGKAEDILIDAVMVPNKLTLSSPKGRLAWEGLT